jgi:ATP-dependent RNA helicase RhlE
MGFTTFGLSEQIIKGISAAGYSEPTPIQSLAILPAVEGKDIVGAAQTGTGKTAAFVLPILQRLSAEGSGHGRGRSPRALVLTPTRELALQVQTAVLKYGAFLPLRAVSVYGGASMGNQLKVLQRGCDIIVATPGRLLDHMERRTIDLSSVRILVLDEADRMLDMGFIQDVRKIIDALPKERQTMLFSATMSPEVSGLAGHALTDPMLVEVGERRNPADGIEQHFYLTTQENKQDLLLHAITRETMESVLVFSRTKHGADKICRRLEKNAIKAVAIHSNRSQSQRERALAGFKKGAFRVLVATDIAARGIDVSGISHVINYDIPHEAADYIHRIGRTGRAGSTGDAITFLARDEYSYLRRIERFIGKQFRAEEYPGFTPRTTTPGPHGKAEMKRPSQAPLSRKPKRKAFAGKRTSVLAPARKKRPVRKMETFSSDTSWSNY